MVDDFEWKKYANKTQLLPSFLTVDRRKKAKQFQDSLRTPYSRPWRNYPTPDSKPNATIQVEEMSYILSY